MPVTEIQERLFTRELPNREIAPGRGSPVSRTAGAALLITDAAGRVIRHDARARLLGGSAIDVPGIRFQDLMALRDLHCDRAVDDPVSRCLADGVAVRVTCRARRRVADALETLLDLTASPLRVGGTVVGTVLLIRDAMPDRRPRPVASRADRTPGAAADAGAGTAR